MTGSNKNIVVVRDSIDIKRSRSAIDYRRLFDILVFICRRQLIELESCLVNNSYIYVHKFIDIVAIQQVHLGKDDDNENWFGGDQFLQW